MADNQSDVFEYKFDFQRYIAQRIQEIEDLEERKFAKKLLLEGFANVVKSSEYKYHELENYIYKELEIPGNLYTVCTAVMKKEHYTLPNGSLVPINSEDLNKDVLKDKLSSSGLIYLETIYLQLSKEECRKFEKQKQRMACMLNLESSQMVYVLIRPAKRYTEAVEWLFHLFKDNHIPWVTVNTGHLEKFYDVFLYKSESIPDITDEEVEIDWGEYKEAVCRGLMPLWNVQRFSFNSIDFKALSIDGIYEHVFFMDDKENKNGYLIEMNQDIMDILREKEQLVLKSVQKTFENWIAVRIILISPDIFQHGSYPVLSNFRKDSFLRRLAKKSRANLMTRSDLYRRIMELDIRDYIDFIGYEILDNGKEYSTATGMNWFIQDELFPMEDRKILLFRFEEKQPGNYLNDSMMHFAISQLQLENNEYRCVGVML